MRKEDKAAAAAAALGVVASGLVLAGLGEVGYPLATVGLGVWLGAVYSAIFC